MSRQWEPKKSTVELQPSRIRREPRSAEAETLIKPQWRSREWEIGLAIVGMILFAIALNIVWLGINAYILD